VRRGAASPSRERERGRTSSRIFSPGRNEERRVRPNSHWPEKKREKGNMHPISKIQGGKTGVFLPASNEERMDRRQEIDGRKEARARIDEEQKSRRGKKKE